MGFKKNPVITRIMRIHTDLNSFVLLV